MFRDNRFRKSDSIIPYIISLCILVYVAGCDSKTNIVRSEQETRINKTITELNEMSPEHSPLIPDDNPHSTPAITEEIFNLELPASNPEDFIITHHGFSLLYNEAHEQSSWVAYEMTKEKATKLFERTDRFVPDPNVTTLTANNKDYAGSGFDRGHLAPASDMGWSEISMAESFYYSNMSPQVPGFNRGIWKKLEELVREWAVENEIIYVVTGPVLTEGLKTIGPNAVSVPEYFYKVILDNHWPDIKGIGFIIANTSSSQPLYEFAVAIDSVEKYTGIDFFTMLPDVVEDSIEQVLCLGCWSWGNDTNSLITDADAKNTTDTIKEAESVTSDIFRKTSVQCSGITKSGSRCKLMTFNLEGKCHLHKQGVD